MRCTRRHLPVLPCVIGGLCGQVSQVSFAVMPQGGGYSMKPKSNDWLWISVGTASFFGLMALLTGHKQAFLGLAVGNLVGGVGKWLYCKYKRA